MRLRVVDIPDDGRRPATVLDIAPGRPYDVQWGSFEVTAPPPTPITAQPGGRWGGRRVVGETHDNGVVAWTVKVTGSTFADALTKVESMLSAIDAVAPGRYLEYRDEDAVYSTYYELRGPASWNPSYQREATLAGIYFFQVSFPVAPLALGDQMDVWEDFSAGNLNDWTFQTGSGTLTASGGQLVPSSTAEKRLYHSARGYQYTDVQTTVKVNIPALGAATSVGVIFKIIDNNNFLYGYLRDNGASSTLNIAKMDGGVFTTLLGSVATTRIVAGQDFWVRARIEGNVITLEHWAAEPTAAGSPTGSASYTLLTTDVTKYGVGVAGYSGILFIPSTTNDRMDDFRAEPYTYASRNLPDEFDLLSVPGTAPALMDVYLGKSSSAVLSAFAAIGWNRTPPAHNLVWNGDFEDNGVTGWSVAAVTNINGAATSIAQDTSSAKYGAANGQVVCPATSGTGANFHIYRRFKKGVTYTFSGWVRSAAQVTSISVRGGNSGANDIATSGGVALSTTWQQISVTWTPTADRDDAFIAFIINAATATTFQIDGVQVYDGTTAPTRGKHAEGAGAQAPLGVIEAESAFSTIGTITADANARGGQVIQRTLPSGALENLGKWYIDPSLLVADDFTEEVTLEVWGRITLPATATTPTFVTRAYGELSGEPRYTLEYGSAGKVILLAGTLLTRLGTIMFPASELRVPQRWFIDIQQTIGGTGTEKLDHLFLVPAQRRVASPSGVSAGIWKFFARTGLAETKRVRYDGAGGSNDGKASSGFAWSPSVGGSLMEPQPGNARAAVLLSGVALPDDPATASGTNDDGTAASKPATVHFAIQPRYRLARAS